MPTIINPSTLSSIIRYIQSIALTLGIPSNDIPDKLYTFVNSINNFFTKVLEYIPTIPDFDVRIRIFILAFGLPTICDLIFMWINEDLVNNIFHIVDIAGLFCLFFQIGIVVFSTEKSFISTYICFPICIVYFIARITTAIYKCRKRKPKAPLLHIVDQLKNYYMKNIIPGIVNELTEEDVENIFNPYNKSFTFKPVEPSVINISFILVVMAGLSCVIAAVFNGFSEVKIMLFIRIAVSVVCGIFLIFLIIVLLMIIIPKLRGPFISLRKFLRRYGVKVLMLIIDFLYIPIARAILENFNYFKNNCSDGFYRSFIIDETNFFDFLMDHNTTCEVCNSNSVSSCINACTSNSVYYSTYSPHLEFINDVLVTTGPIILISFIFVIIGFPILTILVVSHNREIAWSLPVFGRTPEAKWVTIITKLSTPGIFYFYMYKYDISYWALFSPIVKLLAVIFTEMAERLNNQLSYILLIMYLSVFILYIIIKPFIYSFNNVLEIIMAFSNMSLTLVPICSSYGKNVPSWFSIPLSIIACVLPIIAVPYTLCRKSDLEPEMDPGMAIDEDGNYVEPIVPNQEIHLEMIDLMAIWQIVEIQTNKKIHGKSDSDEVQSSTNESDSYSIFYVDDDYISIGRDDLLKAVHDMYSHIDVICDATTTFRIIDMLKFYVLVSTACSGWFFGSIFGKMQVFSNLVC